MVLIVIFMMLFMVPLTILAAKGDFEKNITEN